jgi:EmrB/QacA subfamily drug resistance transporter
MSLGLQRSAARAPGPTGALDRLTTLAAVGVGAYMSALGGSIVNSILPVITRAFESDVAQIEWVITAYLLVQGGLLLSFGRLGDLRGHKSIYVWGFVAFLTGSALCGLAPSLGFLVGARAFQALGAAMIIANSPAILTHTFPPAQRGRVLGMQSTMVYLGLASGPPIGGWLADALGWRATFYANLPIGLLALALSLRFIPPDVPSGRPERFDLAGAAVYVLGLTALLLGLSQGHALGWTSPIVIGSMAAGLMILGAFAAIELRVPNPMLDLGLFRRRAFSAPILSAVLNYLGTSSTFFLVPFYLIQGRGLSPSQAGLLLTAQPIVMATTASLSGAVSDRIGSRLPATAGMAVLGLGLFLLSRLGESTPLGYVAGALAVVGLGIGLFTSPNNSAIMGAVSAQRRGLASGVLATARTLGNVLGVGMAGAIFSTVLAGGESAGPGAVVNGVSLGLLVASVLAFVGALTSATRPGPEPTGERARRSH